MNVPRGIDKLVALASLGAEWREKVLADPLAAAKDAALELSESERAVIKSVAPEKLSGMIDSFKASVPRPSGLGRLAAGAAAAALLAATLSGCGEEREPVGGARPDVPQSKPPDVKPAPPATKGMRADLPEKKG